MNTIDVVTSVTYLFFVYLLLAVFVERTIEVLLALFDYLELKFHWERFWNRKAQHYEERLNRLYVYGGPRDERKKQLFDWILWKVIVDRPNTGGKDIVSADLIRINYVRVASRLTAFVISLIVVLTQWPTVDVVQITNKVLANISKDGGAIPQALKSFLDGLLAFSGFRKILTAALLTMGSEPLHELIKKVETRMDSKSKALAGGKP